MSTRARVLAFLGGYVAVTVLAFLFDHYCMSWPRGDYNLPKWVYLSVGPFLLLDNSAGIGIYLFLVPIGLWVVCAASRGQALVRAVPGVAIWVAANSYFF